MSIPRASEPGPQPSDPPQRNMALALPLLFNADVSLPRLLFLVSPTCEICVTGAMAAAESVLSLPDSANFRLYIMWLPVLEGDTPEAAAQVQARLPTDDRLRHFWDRDLELSQAFHRVLQLGQRLKPHHIAWDIFLLFEAGSIWTEEPPTPEFWMHQLFLEEVPELDAAVLKRRLEHSLCGGSEV